MGLLVKTVNDFKPIAIFTKWSFLDVSQGQAVTKKFGKMSFKRVAKYVSVFSNAAGAHGKAPATSRCLRPEKS